LINFKTLSDIFDHKPTDEALIKVGEIIRSSLKQSDIEARFGGDEFIIIFQSDSVDHARIIAPKND